MKTSSKIALLAAGVAVFLVARKKGVAGIGGFTTEQLEDRVWGFGIRGAGRVHFYARINGKTEEFSNNDTISYDRIQERDEIADNERGTMGLTYKQALERFYKYARDARVYYR